MMIELLGDSDYFDSALIGEDIKTLFDLKARGFNIENSVVITNELFKKYQEKGFIEDVYIKKIFKLFDNIGFSVEEPVYYQTSSKKRCMGVKSDFKSALSFVDIKSSLESIFNSWSSDRARAYRIANCISDEDSLPAIFMQKYYNRVYSIITRTAYGEPTRLDNYNSNIQNQINFFEPYFNELFHVVEIIFKRPARIFFVGEGGKLKICKIAEQNITPIGYWSCLSDLYTKGVIDDLSYIVQVKPYMIERYLGLRMLPQKASVIFKGLPASSGYAIGKLIFPTTFSNISSKKKLSVDKSYICAFYGFSPEYLEILKNHCIGAFSPIGGMICHLAVVSRGLGVPAVTGINDLEVDIQNKIIKFGEKEFSEFTNIAINGNEGELAILKDGRNPFEELYETPKELKKYVDVLADLLSRVTSDQNIFRNLSVDVQLHIASLKNHLRKTGYIE